MENYPGNRQTPTPKEVEKPPAAVKKIEKVIAGKATQRKKPLGKRFVETFFSGSDSVVSYVLQEILIPAIKDTVADMFTQGLERAIYGDARSSSRRTGIRPGSSPNYISYNRFAPNAASTSRPDPRPQLSRQARATHDFREIVLATRRDAEAVTDALLALLDQYNQATVSDLYSLMDIPTTFADEQWGWKDIRGYKVERVNNGYLLDLPQPEQLD